MRRIFFYLTGGVLILSLLLLIWDPKWNKKVAVYPSQKMSLFIDESSSMAVHKNTIETLVKKINSLEHLSVEVYCFGERFRQVGSDQLFDNDSFRSVKTLALPAISETARRAAYEDVFLISDFLFEGTATLVDVHPHHLTLVPMRVTEKKIVLGLRQESSLDSVTASRFVALLGKDFSSQVTGTFSYQLFDTQQKQLSSAVSVAQVGLASLPLEIPLEVHLPDDRESILKLSYVSVDRQLSAEKLFVVKEKSRTIKIDLVSFQADYEIKNILDTLSAYDFYDYSNYTLLKPSDAFSKFLELPLRRDAVCLLMAAPYEIIAKLQKENRPFIYFPLRDESVTRRLFEKKLQLVSGGSASVSEFVTRDELWPFVQTGRLPEFQRLSEISDQFPDQVWHQAANGASAFFEKAGFTFVGIYPLSAMGRERMGSEASVFDVWLFQWLSWLQKSKNLSMPLEPASLHYELGQKVVLKKRGEEKIFLDGKEVSDSADFFNDHKITSGVHQLRIGLKGNTTTKYFSFSEPFEEWAYAPPVFDKAVNQKGVEQIVDELKKQLAAVVPIYEEQEVIWFKPLWLVPILALFLTLAYLRRKVA